MTTTLSRSSFWFVGLALIIVLSEVLIVQSTAFMSSSHWLSLGITADLTLGLPLLYYLLVVRRQSVNRVTTLLVFLLAVGIAHWILPNDHQYFLGMAEKAAIITETIVLVYGLGRIRKIIASYRSASRQSPDVIRNLQQAFTPVLGSTTAMQLVINEIAVFYYGLFFWRARREAESDQTAFTYHRDSAYPALMGALLLVTAIETVVVHILLSRWSPGVALGFTILSAYSFLFLWADLMAVLKRPILLDEHYLHLRAGLRWRAQVPRHLIESVQPIPDTYSRDKDTLNLALMTPPNLRLTFREPVVIQGLYGMQKVTRKITLPIDNLSDFEKALITPENDPSC